MPHVKQSFKTALLGILMLCGSLAQAETERAAYDVYVSGIKIGELQYAVAQSGNSYSSSGVLQSTGIVGAIAKYRYKATSQGTLQNGTYRPQRYTESSDTGRRKMEQSITYRNGLPRVNSSKLAKPYWADPSDQKGTVDPMTGIIATLADQPKSSPCTSKIDIFDGARRVQVTLSNAKISGQSLSCRGLYKRVDGFNKSELSEGVSFPFSLTYAAKGNVFRLNEFTIQTLRGRARFVRQ